MTGGENMRAENIHPQTRMALLARQVVANVLACNAATSKVQAARAIRQAIAEAEAFEEIRQMMDEGKQKGTDDEEQ